MMMNKSQKRTLWVAVSIISLMCLVPPWVFKMEVPKSGSGYLRAQHAGGYRFVMVPPEVPDADWADYASRFWSVHVDFQRLCLQAVPVVLIAGVVISTRRRCAVGQDDGL